MAPIHQQIAARSSAFFYCIGPYALTLTIGITMVVGVGAMFNMNVKDEGTSTATRATNAGTNSIDRPASEEMMAAMAAAINSIVNDPQISAAIMHGLVRSPAEMPSYDRRDVLHDLRAIGHNVDAYAGALYPTYPAVVAIALGLVVAGTRPPLSLV